MFALLILPSAALAAWRPAPGQLLRIYSFFCLFYCLTFTLAHLNGNFLETTNFHSHQTFTFTFRIPLERQLPTNRQTSGFFSNSGSEAACDFDPWIMVQPATSFAILKCCFYSENCFLGSLMTDMNFRNAMGQIFGVTLVTTTTTNVGTETTASSWFV